MTAGFLVRLNFAFLFVLISFFVLSWNSVFAAESKDDCAKDMFFDQLESPTEAINTGFKYWIELYRAGKMKLVDNRTQFKSGDRIRFRVIPNVTGYAYIVMVKGSTGKQSVLFPLSKNPGGKKLNRGQQYRLPSGGFFRFDKNPGTETIRLVLSRKPVSASALLNRDDNLWIAISNNSNSGQTSPGSSSLIAFPEDEGKAIAFNEGSREDFSKDLFYEEAKPRRRTTRRRKPTRHRKPRPRQRSNTQTFAAARRPGVIVINTEPTENLGADIELKHM